MVGSTTLAAAKLTVMLLSTEHIRGTQMHESQIPHLIHPCADPSFPKFSGDWVVGCNESGLVANAWNVHSKILVELPFTFAKAFCNDGYIYSPANGLFEITAQGLEPIKTTKTANSQDTIYTTDGTHLVALTRDSVSVFENQDTTKRIYETHSSQRRGAVLAWPIVVWESGQHGEEALWWSISGGVPELVPTVGTNMGNDRQHMVFGDGSEFGWVSKDKITVMNTNGETRDIAAETGFNGPPSMSNGVVCWEHRGLVDVDIQCSDGLLANGSGHQLWPSRSKEWLIYQIETGKRDTVSQTDTPVEPHQ